MNRRTFLQTACAAGACLATGGRVAAQPARKPNIIVLFADDLGYADLSCYGAEKTRTPNLDRIAAEGLRWSDFYVTSPVCTPSRAGLLTGRYPMRQGYHHVLFPFSTTGLDPWEVTIPEVLKPAGYASACMGKWHLGHLPEYLPTSHGFDYYYGVPYSNDMLVAERGDPPLPVYRNQDIVEQPAQQELLTRNATEEAVNFIAKHKDQPFFLYVPYNMPHIPLFASDKFAGTSNQGLYGDVVEELDWSVGEILRAVEENNLDEDTLVIFTSDNGPWLQKKENGGAAHPLRNGKGTVFEGGVRVPCVMRWPGKLEAGRVVDRPAMTTDFLPTFCALAGVPAPNDRPLDGHDITGMLLGTGTRADEEFYFFHLGELMAMRSGKWKLHTPKEQMANELQGYGWMLFDLDADPGERNELSAQHPEVVARLQGQMKGFLEGMGSPVAKKA